MIRHCSPVSGNYRTPVYKTPSTLNCGHTASRLVIGREVQYRRGEGVVFYQLAILAEALHRESLAIGIEVQASGCVRILCLLGVFLIEKRGKQGEGCATLAEAARALGCGVGIE